jgi:hypothetical protein
MVETDDSLSPGTLLGRYEVKRQLGRGGMGTVYEGVHRDLKKRVAIKVLSGPLASNEEARQRFIREGEAASRIRHPHVVDVTDVGTEGDLTYLVMELLEGEDLAGRLVRGGPLKVREAADILVPVCAGLAVAHDEGIIHRDLKPENIFLAVRRQGGVEPKLLDFGVSKIMGADVMALTGTTAVFGTPYYMPPEQLRGARQVDQRSDVYALGVVLYECVCGRRPFESENVYSILHAIGAGEYPLPLTVRPDLPAEIAATITRAMALDPTMRFPTARHLGAALLPFASDTVRLLWADTFRVAAPSPTSVPVAPPTAPVADQPAAGSVTTFGGAAGQSVDPPIVDNRRPLVVIGGLVVVAAAVAVVLLLRGGIRETAVQLPAAAPAVQLPAAAPVPPAPFHLDVRVSPATAAIELDDLSAGTGRLTRDLPRDGHVHRLTAHLAGYQPAAVEFVDHPPPPVLTLPAIPTPPVIAPAKAATRPETKISSAHRNKNAGHATPAAHLPQQPGTSRPPVTPPPANSVPVLD